jgi:hypothetical protein
MSTRDITKETIMSRPSMSTALLALVLGFSLVSLAMARRDGNDSTLPRLVATVTTLDPRGMATIRTVDGALYQVITGTGWRVGDTVECEQYDVRTPGTQLQLDCRKVS